MTKDEALKLLEKATRSCNNFDEQRALDALMREAQPAQKDNWKNRLIAQHEETIVWQAKRISDLLDQQEAQEPVGCMRCATPKKCATLGCSPNTWPPENITPQQPAQKDDIADLIAGALGVSRGTAYDMMREALALSQPAQEPVASAEYDLIDRFLRNNLYDDDYEEYSAALDSLYTAPPQRPWVGLTDDDLMVAAYQAGFDIHEDYDNEEESGELHWWTPDGEVGDDALLKLGDILEAKIKEKNT